jgi:Tfp pilus assembly protein PilF
MSQQATGDNTTSAEAQPSARWLPPIICVCLALAVWLVFGQTLHHEFVNVDDNQGVYEHPLITQGLSLHGVAQLLTHIDPVTHDWWPLSEISHMVDWQLYGANAGGHHLTNVLLHAATAILLFLVLRNMTGALWQSAFVAAVFAIHPLRVESVAWVSERKDVLSGLFFMLTLWAYARYARQPKTGNYLLTLFFFACGLLSKSMLVTLPFVLLLLDYWPLRRITFPLHTSHFRLLVEKVPFLLLSAAACGITLVAHTHTNMEDVRGVNLFRLTGNALVAYAGYLGHLVYPAGLALYYSHHPAPWKMIAALLVLAVISAGAIAGWRKHPFLLVGWLWYLGMLVPVATIQSGLSAQADRYTYLPQIGLSIMAAWGAVELCGSWRHRRIALGSVSAAVIAALMAAAYVQTGYWKDSITLWTHTLSCTSENYIAHNDLGNMLAKQGKLDEAIQHYQQALQFNPDYVDAHNNLGVALARQGKLPEAVEQYQRALQLDPSYAKARNNLGNIMARQGRLPEAAQQYEQALQLNPDYIEAHYNLGNVLAAEGKLDEAIQHYQQALNLAGARNNPALAETIRTRLKSLTH